MHRIKSILNFVHSKFLWLMLCAYFISIIFPDFGLQLRDISLGKIVWFDKSTVRLSLPLLMLSLILFNAGLSVKTREIIGLVRKPWLLVIGLLANLLIPIVFTLLVSVSAGVFTEPPELQYILIGLALIASMPIAASSTAWSQKSNANLALSLGLVAFSTILSPITTPIGLKAVGYMTSGVYSDVLFKLSQQGTSAFLTISVLIPTLLGILCHLLIGEKRLAKIHQWVKLVNLADLLLLSYSNAALVLPQAFRKPDWDYLFLIVLVVGSMCSLAFLSGFAITHIFRSTRSEKLSLMFGLGMNNNGTGLVLASTTLSEFPLVMLPMIFYNIVQQIVAGVVDFLILKNDIFQLHRTAKNTL